MMYVTLSKKIHRNIFISPFLFKPLSNTTSKLPTAAEMPLNTKEKETNQ